MTKLTYLFFFLTAIFGNEFLKLNIKGLNTISVLIFFSFIYFLLNSRKIYLGNNKLLNYFKFCLIIFYCLAISYIFMSHFGYQNIFNIDKFGFNKNFIPRQSYFIFAITVGISIAYEIINDKFRFNFNLKFTLFVFSIMVIFRLFNVFERVGFSALLISISTYIYFMNNKKIGLVTLMVLVLLLGFNFSTYILMYFMILLLLLNINILKVILKKEILFFIYFSSITAFLIIYIFYDDIILVFNDPNSIWRWQFWIHEFKILIQTYGLGVGFGTPYANLDIFNEIINPNAFIVSKDYFNYSINDVLYITAQHNSFVNIFYRLGIIGGFLFIFINLIPIYIYTFTNKVPILNWAYLNFIINIIVILVNPGLESPRFFIGYLISFSIFIGLLTKFINYREEEY